MKKTLIALTLCCAAILSARDITVALNSAKIGDATIPGWVINKSNKAADYGKGEIIAGSEADEKAFKITPPADRATSFYTAAAHKAKPGDKVELSAKVKGKGSFSFGYYTYDATGARFLSGVRNTSKSHPLKDEWTEVEIELVVGTSPQGEIGMIRPVISVAKGAELIIEDIEIEIDEKN